MMRDLKCTLGEAHIIPLGEFDVKLSGEARNTLPDISKMLPANCPYTKGAIEAALHNLDEFIQCYLRAHLKWETIILIYGSLNHNLKTELIFDSDCDTLEREDIMNKISEFLIGIPWPTYGATEKQKDDRKILLTASLDKYSREMEYF